ncbi:hypothetical protein [Saccharomonospora piscinae]|uniref:hypothetical protein n=1 Tax=Saccharomonospora piscinae TaxID=687388 RepID=UPI00141EBEE7|nr:hypothetical protein [Saccharomonospora piscinae]
MRRNLQLLGWAFGAFAGPRSRAWAALTTFLVRRQAKPVAAMVLACSAAVREVDVPARAVVSAVGDDTDLGGGQGIALRQVEKTHSSTRSFFTARTRPHQHRHPANQVEKVHCSCAVGFGLRCRNSFLSIVDDDTFGDGRHRGGFVTD